MQGRSGKQCRERWNNHLSPEVTKKAWSLEEHQQLFESHAKYGNRWSLLASFLPGRSENSIKNFINSTIRRNLRKHNKHYPQARIQTPVSEILQTPELMALLFTPQLFKAKEIAAATRGSARIQSLKTQGLTQSAVKHAEPSATQKQVETPQSLLSLWSEGVFCIPVPSYYYINWG